MKVMEEAISFSQMIHLKNLNILFLLGIALFGGTIGGRIFEKLRIPKVVGYIFIGFLLGGAGLKVIDMSTINMMQPFNYFALGIIGFMIGGELKKEAFAKYGKQFVYILLSEGLTAFIFVSVLIILVGAVFFGFTTQVITLGLILGAIASATAPAATTDVLWEYKTKGPLTSTVIGIVAMDDALSLMLFAICSSIANTMLLHAGANIMNTVLLPVYEIAGSVIVGGLMGLLLSVIVRKYFEEEGILAFSIGLVLLVLGLAEALKLDMILAAMALGTVLTNTVPHRSEEVFKFVARFAPPIFVLFFVLFGAKLNISSMSLPLIIMTVVYLVGRTFGKGLGAMFGAKVSGAPRTVQKYLPFCLFSQAGVAIGLSILASQRFHDTIGDSIVIIITTTTFVVQLIGPPSVKWAAGKAGEVGLNITEEDLIRNSKVKDIMNEEVPVLKEETSLHDVLRVFGETSFYHFPVVNNEGKLVGVITVSALKDSCLDPELGSILIAQDMMEPVKVTVSPDTPLSDIRNLFERYNLDYLPVVVDGKVLGMIEEHALNKLISEKIIELKERAQALETA